mmetsp:Transcript_13740/g.36811  ORF Transcript_13740/g.36811 Transcript_13740/m.36811 type:complete len:473 (+) Transcript_13740:57-1475(+)|eukprot:CAMPEP_0185182990 /NCGR_PEP_ID=MMETSP1140-20130426/1687_1 /TAXON_ID=298111 /ORGANISM="Pavlova sp., Strain CCMP459" /LENGTH=472 /DNA_ID=CAMNT_0027748963 /DNA_START=57 /DNA_END=1475 /DNA_ORIENTATION=-
MSRAASGAQDAAVPFFERGSPMYAQLKDRASSLTPRQMAMAGNSSGGGVTMGNPAMRDTITSTRSAGTGSQDAPAGVPSIAYSSATLRNPAPRPLGLRRSSGTADIAPYSAGLRASTPPAAGPTSRGGRTPTHTPSRTPRDSARTPPPSGRTPRASSAADRATTSPAVLDARLASQREVIDALVAELQSTRTVVHEQACALSALEDRLAARTKEEDARFDEAGEARAGLEERLTSLEGRALHMPQGAVLPSDAPAERGDPAVVISAPHHESASEDDTSAVTKLAKEVDGLHARVSAAEAASQVAQHAIVAEGEVIRAELSATVQAVRENAEAEAEAVGACVQRLMALEEHVNAEVGACGSRLQALEALAGNAAIPHHHHNDEMQTQGAHPSQTDEPAPAQSSVACSKLGNGEATASMVSETCTSHTVHSADCALHQVASKSGGPANIEVETTAPTGSKVLAVVRQFAACAST